MEEGYQLLPDGRHWFLEVGIDVPAPHSESLTRRCVDWSERRYHLGAYGNQRYHWPRSPRRFPLP